MGPAGSIRSFSELHPWGKIPFPVSKIPSTCTFRHTGWTFLNKVSTDFCPFLVSCVITPYSNHWSDLCWDYTLPRPPQKHTSAKVEVSIWFFQPRHHWAGWTLYYEWQWKGHMEFNSVHSNVTNRIRIFHVTWSTKGRLHWLVSKREQLFILLIKIGKCFNFVIFFFRLNRFLLCTVQVLNLRC